MADVSNIIWTGAVKDILKGGGRVSKRLVSRNFQSDKQKSRGGGVKQPTPWIRH